MTSNTLFIASSRLSLEWTHFAIDETVNQMGTDGQHRSQVKRQNNKSRVQTSVSPVSQVSDKLVENITSIINYQYICVDKLIGGQC